MGSIEDRGSGKNGSNNNNNYSENSYVMGTAPNFIGTLMKMGRET